MCQNQIGLRDIQNSAIEQDKNLKRKNLELGRNAISCAVVTLIVTAVLMIAPHEAVASATITQKTGQPCTKCHTTPPALNDYGSKYKSKPKK